MNKKTVQAPYRNEGAISAALGSCVAEYKIIPESMRHSLTTLNQVLLRIRARTFHCIFLSNGDLMNLIVSVPLGVQSELKLGSLSQMQKGCFLFRYS